MSTSIVREDRDGVRVLRMQFGRANALGPEVVESLGAELSASTGPTVLTGHGSAFSAGLDLVALAALDRPTMEAFLERLSTMLMQALTLRAPLVAAINGHCVAGGCVLAMACDHRVGTRGRFKVGVSELAIGLTLPALPLEIVRGNLPVRVAHRVILGAELFAPDAAREIGLLDEVAPGVDACVDRACTVARELGGSSVEFASMKGTLVAPIAERFRENRGALDRRFLDTWFSESGTRLRAEVVERLRSRDRSE